MPSVKDEIRQAIEKLSLSQQAIRELSDSEGAIIYHRALRHFVSEGEPRWWWEHFITHAAVDFPAGDGWQHIGKFVPDVSETVWFIVEDDLLPFYPVYEATPSTISAIIPECYGFEYYIIQKDFHWLLCETHHNTLIGVGKVVEQKMKSYLK